MTSGRLEANGGDGRLRSPHLGMRLLDWARLTRPLVAHPCPVGSTVTHDAPSRRCPGSGTLTDASTPRVVMPTGLRLAASGSGYGRSQRYSSPPCHAGTFGDSTRDIDLALTLAFTEMLAFRDLIRPTGSQPELTPVLLAPPLCKEPDPDDLA